MDVVQLFNEDVWVVPDIVNIQPDFCEINCIADYCSKDFIDDIVDICIRVFM